jgi:hypothetical protein
MINEIITYEQEQVTFCYFPDYSSTSNQYSLRVFRKETDFKFFYSAISWFLKSLTIDSKFFSSTLFSRINSGPQLSIRKKYHRCLQQKKLEKSTKLSFVI